MKNFTKLVDKQLEAYVKRMPEEKRKYVEEINLHFDAIMEIIEKHSRKDGRYKNQASKRLNDTVILTMKALSIPI